VEKARHWQHKIEVLDVQASRATYFTERREDPCFAPVRGSRESVNTTTSKILSPVQVLLVEDSPGAVRLTQEAFRNANPNVELHVTADVVEAMDFLRRKGSHIGAPRPDLVLLDLNLPRLDGREVLALVKKDRALRTIPIVVLSTSAAEVDIATSYNLHANCYLTKPVDLDDFDDLVKRINEFWIDKVKLPRPAKVA
jgi:two-component system, chemotaxis family, response regulator Rcp1